MTTELTSKELERLDQWISLILSGDSSVEDCLDEVTEHREEIESLLRTAVFAHTYAAPDPANKTFVRNSKARVLNQLAANRQAATSKEPKFRRVHLRPAFGLLGLFLAIGLSLSMVVNASASSLPGDSLYSIKRGVEAARLVLTIDPHGDARLLLEFLDERLDEASTGFETGRGDDALTALDGYQETVDQLLDLTKNVEIGLSEELFTDIEVGLENQHQKLLVVLENAPDSAKTGLEKALERSSHGKEVIEQLHQGGRPSDLAPGQQKKTEQPNNSPEGSGRPEDKPTKDKEKESQPGAPGNGDN
jgi:hypothetical protein